MDIGLSTLILLGSLRYRIENAKIMLGMLEVAFRHDPIPRAGRIASELQVFLEELLRGAAHAQIRAVAVEDMVAIERNLTVVVTNWVSTTTAAATAAWTMVAASHAFHVHQSVAALS